MHRRELSGRWSSYGDAPVAGEHADAGITCLSGKIAERGALRNSQRIMLQQPWQSAGLSIVSGRHQLQIDGGSRTCFAKLPVIPLQKITK